MGCLQRFGQRLRDLHRDNVRIVGTNTLRKARNSAQFLARAQEALGHPGDHPCRRHRAHPGSTPRSRALAGRRGGKDHVRWMM